jgi:agmatine deiminase
MVFPCEGPTLGSSDAERAAGYAAWVSVALAVAAFEPVTMVVDPSEVSRARNVLGADVELLEAPVDEFWARDVGPTFVVDGPRLGAVDWVFNGWGANEWAVWDKSARLGRVIAEAAGAELIASELVNEGGGIHVDGAGTVLVTDTVQLGERRNPGWSRNQVEAELARTLGVTRAIWLPRGLTRDYDDFGTSGHVDIVASFIEQGRVLLHAQESPDHPDYQVSLELGELLKAADLDVVPLPAPATLTDEHGPVDFSYVNHYVVNGGVIACGFGEQAADARAREILGGAYPGREVVTVDAREIFARGGGIHCITQQEPRP